MRALALASLLVFALSASAVAATKVNVRVEGAKATLFEGNVAVSAGKLTSNTGEDRSSHLCNVAANGGSGPPAATPTRALQAASENALGDRLAPLSFEWYASFSDFLIGSIGGEAPTGDNYWELSINWKVAELGGCAEGCRVLRVRTTPYQSVASKCARHNSQPRGWGLVTGLRAR